jgi:hypothetical protein
VIQIDSEHGWWMMARTVLQSTMSLMAAPSDSNSLPPGVLLITSAIASLSANAFSSCFSS